MLVVASAAGYYPFQDPVILERLRKHHTTKDYLDDPSFVRIIKELQRDPELLRQLVAWFVYRWLNCMCIFCVVTTIRTRK